MLLVNTTDAGGSRSSRTVACAKLVRSALVLVPGGGDGAGGGTMRVMAVGTMRVQAAS